MSARRRRLENPSGSLNFVKILKYGFMNLKSLLLAVLGVASLAPCAAQTTEDIPYRSTHAIAPDDTPETIVRKAAHVVPTPNQLAALRNEFIAFVHFGPNTFTRREWGDGMEDPRVFDLRTLDTDQWCAAMRDAGMKMVLLTVKHHDGFVLWQSRYTRHGIMSSPFCDGRGDILRSLSESCRRYGLKLGVYLSPADLYQIEHPEGLYGNGSAYTRRTIPREVPGRPFACGIRFEFEVDDYNEYFLNQLYELLTEYGPIDEVWFDGAHPKRKGGQRYNYAAWRTLIRTLAPRATIFGREDVRWCGNEAGATRDTEWNVIPYASNPDTMTRFSDLTDYDLGSRARLCEGRYLHYQQAETDTSIREGWFYRDDEHQQTRSADDVFDIYERSVGGNATLLLNIPPDREGRLPATDVAVLEEVGRRIRATYGTDLLAGAEGPAALLDGDPDTFVELEPERPEVLLRMPRPVKINRLVLQEAVGVRGERVERHVVDAWVDGAWRRIAEATNIGYKRILRFPDVETDRLRIRIEEMRAVPALCLVSAHRYDARPPRLEVRRDAAGCVVIRPARQTFDWKSHGEDVAANLNAGFEIRYTLDGSQPGPDSPRYEGPFVAENVQLRAVALLGDAAGAVVQERLGWIPQGWRVHGASSELEGCEAACAFDADPSTVWRSQPGDGDRFLTIDLGAERMLSGMAYTPPADGQGGIARGVLRVSADGERWTEAARFEFGNLVNDPSRRFCPLDAPVRARYVRIEAEALAADAPSAAVAELELF